MARVGIDMSILVCCGWSLESEASLVCPNEKNEGREAGGGAGFRVGCLSRPEAVLSWESGFHR